MTTRGRPSKAPGTRKVPLHVRIDPGLMDLVRCEAMVIGCTLTEYVEVALRLRSGVLES